MKSYGNVSLVENHTIIKKILVSCLLSFVLCSKTIAMSFPDNPKNKKAPSQTFLRVQLGTAWRREGDSNPRYAFTYARFPSVCLKPLNHLSISSQSILTQPESKIKRKTSNCRFNPKRAQQTDPPLVGHKAAISTRQKTGLSESRFKTKTLQ